ncbi:zinc ribbon domain-containing protein [Oscillospiraceae bacterium MB08-C2-2]|nr:zinc ribbon domain-containing protein [Oscillospiraceae bacterium MB08-C2-2]
MSKLEEFMDDVLFGAKWAADVAGKKTTEVVEVSKLKYQAKQITWDIERAYAKLGAIVYEAQKSKEDFGELVDVAVAEVDKLRKRLAEVEKKILDFKNICRCENCGKYNEESAFYCARCGTQLKEEPEVGEDGEMPF